MASIEPSPAQPSFTTNIPDSSASTTLPTTPFNDYPRLLTSLNAGSPNSSFNLAQTQQQDQFNPQLSDQQQQPAAHRERRFFLDGHPLTATPTPASPTPSQFTPLHSTNPNSLSFIPTTQPPTLPPNPYDAGVLSLPGDLTLTLAQRRETRPYIQTPLNSSLLTPLHERFNTDAQQGPAMGVGVYANGDVQVAGSVAHSSQNNHQNTFTITNNPSPPLFLDHPLSPIQTGPGTPLPTPIDRDFTTPFQTTSSPSHSLTTVQDLTPTTPTLPLHPTSAVSNPFQLPTSSSSPSLTNTDESIAGYATATAETFDQLRPRRSQDQRSVTNTHYIHPLVQLSTTAQKHPYPNTPRPTPPATLSSRAAQQTLQSLDDDLIGFMYFSFKQIFDVFNIYNFDDRFLLEFSLGFKFLLFCHYDLLNQPSYLAGLQNMAHGKIADSTLSQRLHIDTVFGAGKGVLTALFQTTKSLTQLITKTILKLLLKAITKLPPGILIRLVTWGQLVIKAVKPVINLAKNLSHSLTQPFSSLYHLNFHLFGTSLSPIKATLRPLVSFISHSVLPIILGKSSTSQHPSSSTWHQHPSTISQQKQQQLLALNNLDGAGVGKAAAKNADPQVGLSMTQRILFLIGGLFVPYAWKSLERRIRQEDWQYTPVDTDNEPPQQQEEQPPQPQSEPGVNSSNEPQSETFFTRQGHPLGVDSTLNPGDRTRRLGGKRTDYWKYYNQDENQTPVLLVPFYAMYYTGAYIYNSATVLYNLISNCIDQIGEVIRNKIHSLLTDHYQTPNYRRHIATLVQRIDLWFRIITFTNTLAFISSGKYITPLQRVLNITSVMINPSAPQPPPIFDTIYQQIANLLVTDVLSAMAQIVLSLSNTNSSLFLQLPFLLPIGFFFRNTTQQLTATRDNLQSQVGRRDSDPITLFDHIGYIWNRLCGRGEPGMGQGNVTSNQNSTRNQQNNTRTRPTPSSVRSMITMARSQSRHALPLQRSNTHQSSQSSFSVNNMSIFSHPASHLSQQSQHQLPPTKLPPCPLCRKQPTMPCQLTACEHIYCWYCCTQLHSAKQVCVECYVPILGFYNFGQEKPLFESTNDIAQRNARKEGILTDSTPKTKRDDEKKAKRVTHDQGNDSNTESDNIDDNSDEEKSHYSHYDAMNEINRSYISHGGMKQRSQMIIKRRRKRHTWKPPAGSDGKPKKSS